MKSDARKNEEDNLARQLAITQKENRALQAENEELRRMREELWDLVTSAQCLFWHSMVEERDGEYIWDIKLPDEVTAQKFLPLKIAKGQTWSDAWLASRHPEDYKRAVVTSRDALRSGKTRYSHEIRHTDIDCHTRWLLEDVRIQNLGDGRWHLVGICADVTERKRAESDARYLVESAGCLIWHARVERWKDDFIWDFQIPSEETAQRFLPLKLKQGESWLDGWVSSRLPEDFEKAEKVSVEALLSGADDYQQELRHKRADDQIRTLLEDVRIQKINETRWQLVGVCTDITEQKRAEEELRHVMESARCILWQATVYEFGGHFTWEVKITNEHHAAQFLPLMVHENQTWENAWYECKFPEDMQVMDAVFQEAVRERKKEYDNEFRCRRKDGQVRWMYEMVRVEYKKSNVWELVGVCTDITARKKGEMERQRLRGELDAAMNKVKELREMLPICSSCKKIRDDEGYWSQVENYLSSQVEVQVSHGICPDCIKRLYPNMTDLV